MAHSASAAAAAASRARLAPFVHLAQTASGAAAAQLCSDAAAAPGVYAFAELLAVPGIRQLADGPHARAFALLRLFAYGELSDWIASPDSFPPLRPAHVAKLRHLTLLRLCSSARIVPYATLLEALHLDVQAPSGASTPVAQPVRALEDCIIDAVYAGILGARLDQRAARVEVQGCLGRDVGGPEEVLQLEQGLAEWEKTTQELLRTLAERIDRARGQDAVSVANRADHDQYLEGSLHQLLEKSGPGGLGSSGGAAGAASGGMGAASAWAREAEEPRGSQRKRTRA